MPTLTNAHPKSFTCLFVAGLLFAFMGLAQWVNAEEPAVSIIEPIVQYLPSEGNQGAPSAVVRYKIANGSPVEILAYKVIIDVYDAVGDRIITNFAVLNTTFLPAGEDRMDFFTYSGEQAQLLERYATATVRLKAIRYEDGTIWKEK